MPGYCEFAKDNPIHQPYHDTEYGFPTKDERVLFERLSLEIMQAGLSWEIVLKKRAGMNAAFHRFDVDRVAAYGDRETARLLADANIIRNRLKVAAIIENAKRFKALRSEGGIAKWLERHHPMSKKDWTKVFKKSFKFTGGEIVGEFLMSIGYLPSPHETSCPVHATIMALSPPWAGVDPKVYDEV
ncbi:MAG: DNA-3-methyladenine glycosylase I [Rhodospirillales bacterium]